MKKPCFTPLCEGASGVEADSSLAIEFCLQVKTIKYLRKLESPSSLCSFSQKSAQSAVFIS